MGVMVSSHIKGPTNTNLLRSHCSPDSKSLSFVPQFLHLYETEHPEKVFSQRLQVTLYRGGAKQQQRDVQNPGHREA